MTSKELLKLRLKLMVTQAELARRAGIEVTSLNRQERGTMKIRPSLARLYTLLAHYGDDACKVLGIEPKGRIRRYVRRRRRKRPDMEA